jgi:hypothetical protein
MTGKIALVGRKMALAAVLAGCQPRGPDPTMMLMLQQLMTQEQQLSAGQQQLSIEIEGEAARCPQPRRSLTR